MLVKPSSLLSKTLKADGYFCGAGGLEVAFKSAIAHLGIDAAIRIGVNHWDIAIQAFGANHPEANVACMDVRKFDLTQFGQFDIGCDFCFVFAVLVSRFLNQRMVKGWLIINWHQFVSCFSRNGQVNFSIIKQSI